MIYKTASVVYRLVIFIFLILLCCDILSGSIPGCRQNAFFAGTGNCLHAAALHEA